MKVERGAGTCGREEKVPLPAGEPVVSIVIPVWNAAETLGIQLGALAVQSDAPPFEVIIADNGSTDNSVEVAASFTIALRLRVVDASAHRGPSFARNVGARAAATPNLLFCDADDRVSRNWVAAMHRALYHYRIVTGPMIYVNELAPGMEPPLPSVIRTEPRRYLDQVAFAGTGNLAVRADLWRELGGFDCELRCVQDAEFTIRAQVAGNSLSWAQEALVFVGRRDSLARSAKQFFRYGYYDALLYRKLRGNGLSRRSLWDMLRPYLVLAATLYRLLTRRRWSWIVNASQRAGRLVGSARFGVFCP